MRKCWKLKEEALDHKFWRTRFGSGYGPVIRWTVWWWLLCACADWVVCWWIICFKS